ncbi:unnamed protein product [Cyprideis torosa]|uniref:Uncharacterized protein n=1 Tax=Cyprideis torosa TaxID=163714 RepID=A0A7R8WAZ4_9CRUS|nr:unnamed protein product [Cyprideis torosa]CAG0886836.1 unnamed protein product [Cyprideis torosa]
MYDPSGAHYDDHPIPPPSGWAEESGEAGGKPKERVYFPTSSTDYFVNPSVKKENSEFGADGIENTALDFEELDSYINGGEVSNEASSSYLGSDVGGSCSSPGFPAFDVVFGSAPTNQTSVGDVLSNFCNSLSSQVGLPDSPPESEPSFSPPQNSHYSVPPPTVPLAPPPDASASTFQQHTTLRLAEVRQREVPKERQRGGTSPVTYIPKSDVELPEVVYKSESSSPSGITSVRLNEDSTAEQVRVSTSSSSGGAKRTVASGNQPGSQKRRKKSSATGEGISRKRRADSEANEETSSVSWKGSINPLFPPSCEKEQTDDRWRQLVDAPCPSRTHRMVVVMPSEQCDCCVSLPVSPSPPSSSSPDHYWTPPHHAGDAPWTPQAWTYAAADQDTPSGRRADEEESLRPLLAQRDPEPDFPRMDALTSRHHHPQHPSSPQFHGNRCEGGSGLFHFTHANSSSGGTVSACECPSCFPQQRSYRPYSRELPPVPETYAIPDSSSHGGWRTEEGGAAGFCPPSNWSASPPGPGHLAPQATTYAVPKEEDPSDITVPKIEVMDAEMGADMLGATGNSVSSNSGEEKGSQGQPLLFSPFQQHLWVSLVGIKGEEIPTPNIVIDADKGFNYANVEEAFVCQKKNHFQLTVHIEFSALPTAIRTPGGIRQVENFRLLFYGVKAESPSQIIRIEQSQPDRSKKELSPIVLDVGRSLITKRTVGRMHFKETTSNNMRKKGRPNPDQRYFLLVVSLVANTTASTDGEMQWPVATFASEKLIVRASNPGQFEADPDLMWQRGMDSIFHMGRVGVNTDRVDESLCVNGNVRVTGSILQPSDRRIKTAVEEIDPRRQLETVQRLRVVQFQYSPEVAKALGLSEPNDTGIIAQELLNVLPEAVQKAGEFSFLSSPTDPSRPDGENELKSIPDFLVVNKDRIFMENVGAVKELARITGSLERRVGRLEGSSTGGTSKTKSGPPESKERGQRTGCEGVVFTPPLPANLRRKKCSGKILPLILGVLVAVMAVCVIAMASLYFLEFHQRSTLNFTSSSSLESIVSLSTNLTANSSVPTTSSRSGHFHNLVGISGSSSEFHISSKDHLYHRPYFTSSPRFNPTEPPSPMDHVFRFLPTPAQTQPSPFSFALGKPETCNSIRKGFDRANALFRRQVPCPIYCCSNGVRLGLKSLDDDRNQSDPFEDKEVEKDDFPYIDTADLSLPFISAPVRKHAVRIGNFSPAGGPSEASAADLLRPAGALSTNGLTGGPVASTSSGIGKEALRPTTGPPSSSAPTEGKMPVEDGPQEDVAVAEKPVGEKISDDLENGIPDLGVKENITPATFEPRRRLPRHLLDKDGSLVAHGLGEPKSNEENDGEKAPSLNAVEPIGLQSPSVGAVTMVDFNVTLGPRYCLRPSRGCHQSDLSSPNISFAIPVSKFMPLLHLRVEFTLGGVSPQAMMTCPAPVAPTACGWGSALPRQDARSHATKTRLHPQTAAFSLEVGNWMTRAFRFRVSLDPHRRQDVCSLPSASLGRDFLEANLLFYRVCDE